MSSTSRSRSVKACMLCQNRSNVTDTQTSDPLQRITYHRFPMGKERRDRWLEFCGQKVDSFASLKFKFICSNHFGAECFERDFRSELLDGVKRMVLKKDALPTIRTDGQQLTRSKVTQGTDEEERTKRKEEVEKLLTGEMSVVEPIVNPFRKHICEERPKAKRRASPFRNANEMNGPEVIRVLSPLSETEMLQRIAQLERMTGEQNKLIEQLQQTIDHKTARINFAKEELVNVAISLQEIKDNENKHVTACITQLLSNRFSESQLAAISAGPVSNASRAPMDIPWTSDDLAKALELRCISKDAFQYVLQKLNYPLPDTPQIERWIHSTYLETGTNLTAFRLLELHAASLSHTDLICSLHISQTASPVRYHYDRKRDQIFGPTANMHCIAVQGLFADWVQLVHVAFDLSYNLLILWEIIAKLHRLHYHVVAITTGCDHSMAGVWNALGVCYEQHFIRHPLTDDLVYMFVCPDGMLSVIRRILVDDGFIMQQNNFMINKDKVISILDRLIVSDDPRIASTLIIDHRHTNPCEAYEESCNLSRELISHSTSNALKILAGENDEDDDTLSTICTLFDIFIDWYELCTSTNAAGLLADEQQQPSSITRLPYGTCEDEQNIILDAMFDVMEHFRSTNPKNNFLPEAVLISINSTRRLLADVRRFYPGQITCIPMQRLGLSPIRGTIATLQRTMKNETNTNMSTMHAVLDHLCQAVIDDTQGSHVSNRLLQLSQLSGKKSLPIVKRPEDSTDTDVSGVTELNACQFLMQLIANRLGHKYEYLLEEQTIVIDRKNDQFVIRQDNDSIADTIVPSALWSEQAKILESHMSEMIHDRTPALAESMVNRIHNQYPRLGRDLVEMYVRKRIAIQVHVLNCKLNETCDK